MPTTVYDRMVLDRPWRLWEERGKKFCRQPFRRFDSDDTRERERAITRAVPGVERLAFTREKLEEA